MVRDGDTIPRGAARDAGGRRFPIRFKLAAALAVPMAALTFVASTKVLQTRQDAQEASDQAELALSATGPGSLVRSLQTERNHTSAYLLDQEAMVDIEEGAYAAARSATDEALADFGQVIEDAGAEVEGAYRPAIEAMDGLGELRRTVDEFAGTRDLNNVEMMEEVFDGYSALISQLFDANRQVSLAVNDLVLRRGAALVNLATRNSDTVAVLTRTLVQATVAGGQDGVNQASEITRVAGLLSQLRRNEVSIRENGVGVYRRYVEALFASDHTQRFPQAVEGALETGVVELGSLLGNAGDREGFGYDSLLDAVEQELEDEAHAVSDDADRTRTLYTIFGFVVVLLGGVMTWLVSRSITRPLRSLTRQATAMANEHLPGAVLDILETPLGEDVTVPEMTPIRINTRDEVADVADALNTVQTSALDLAVEQAVLRRNIADSFVNLGRRNQNLLSRQLDFITELERNETDPDVLASLFRLDHLATRMRRNAESLLVLAGIEPPRKWAAPVRLTDVIRAALSEIEDYQRVTVVAVEPATVLGSVAADLAHLLAELMENAVTFSPPDQTVEVRGRSQASGYVLVVIDQGLGMTPDEIEAANRRLAGTESFTVAPSKYLGHYVTGNLAARHGIEVRLQSSPMASLGAGGGGGITATITLPASLLTTEAGSQAPDSASMRPAAQAVAVQAAGPALAGALAAPSGGAVRSGPGSGNGVTPRPTAAPTPWSSGGNGGSAQPAAARTAWSPAADAGDRPGGDGVALWTPGGSGGAARGGGDAPGGWTPGNDEGMRAGGTDATTPWTPGGSGATGGPSGWTPGAGAGRPGAGDRTGWAPAGSSDATGRWTPGGSTGTAPGGWAPGTDERLRAGGNDATSRWTPGSGDAPRGWAPAGGAGPASGEGRARPGAGDGAGRTPADTNRQPRPTGATAPWAAPSDARTPGGTGGAGGWAPPSDRKPGGGTPGGAGSSTRTPGGTGAPGGWGPPADRKPAGDATASWSPGAGGPGGWAPGGTGGAASSSPAGGPAAREQAGRRVFDALAALPTFDKRRSQPPTGPAGLRGGAPSAAPEPAGSGDPASRPPDRPSAAWETSGPAFALTPPGGTPTLPRQPFETGGQTARGLARRVRGANLPANRPVNLRRSSAPGDQGTPLPADDVYSFLSNFQAGVQRGLDAARRDEQGPDEPSPRS